MECHGRREGLTGDTGLHVASPDRDGPIRSLFFLIYGIASNETDWPFPRPLKIKAKGENGADHRLTRDYMQVKKTLHTHAEVYPPHTYIHRAHLILNNPKA